MGVNCSLLPPKRFTIPAQSNCSDRLKPSFRLATSDKSASPPAFSSNTVSRAPSSEDLGNINRLSQASAACAGVKSRVALRAAKADAARWLASE